MWAEPDRQHGWGRYGTIGEFVGGTLLSPEEMAQINAWIGTPAQDWEICYSRAIHGVGGGRFHTECDGYEGTVTVLTNGGKKFGGYTPIAWNGTTTGYLTEPAQSSFLFSLTNNHRHAMIRAGNDIYNNPTQGPTFGGGQDLSVYTSSVSSISRCQPGYTYACRVSQPGLPECREDLCGPTSSTWTFSPDQLEVYRRRN